jgi:tetratricopeptide (TPR) repeat protein
MTIRMARTPRFAAARICACRVPSFLFAAALFALAFSSSPCFAQGAAPGTKATVQSDSLPVYSQMDDSSPVVCTMKKGDALTVSFQIAGSTGNWCGVRLPGQNAPLGYVDCGSLDIRQPPPTQGPEPPADQPVTDVSGTRPSRPALHLSFSSPASPGANAYDRIKKLVVPEDEIDTVKMEEFDAEARGGSAAAMDRAALAHIAAGNFDLSEKDTRKAIDQYSSAVQFAAQNPNILFAALLEIAYVHLLRSEFAAARPYLARAQTLQPDSAAVAELSGWTDYGLDRLNDAVAELEKAQRLQPNGEVAALLDKVRRDQQTESSFQRSTTNHFILRYQGGAAPGLAQDVLNALEGDFQTLQDALQFTPPQPITVVLYTNQTFRDITRAPNWSGAINDGRIRIPVQGLSTVTPELARELRHELTHSFVRQMTDGRCPTWLNEGLAEYFEGRRSNAAAQALVTMYQERKSIPLSTLEGSWMRFPTPLAVYSYAWSLAAVESIIANSGMYGIERLFNELKQEESVQMALETALQLSYSDLELQTIQYLQRTYLH